VPSIESRVSKTHGRIHLRIRQPGGYLRPSPPPLLAAPTLLKQACGPYLCGMAAQERRFPSLCQTAMVIGAGVESARLSGAQTSHDYDCPSEAHPPSRTVDATYAHVLHNANKNAGRFEGRDPQCHGDEPRVTANPQRAQKSPSSSTALQLATLITPSSRPGHRARRPLHRHGRGHLWPPRVVKKAGKNSFRGAEDREIQPALPSKRNLRRLAVPGGCDPGRRQ